MTPYIGRTRSKKTRNALLGARAAETAKSPQETHMDTTTLLIIILLVVLLGGGGWYGRGRWF